MIIPLAKPDITNLERKRVLNVLKTPFLSLGPELKRFEKEIAKYIGVKYAVAVNSGTSALQLIIRALEIKRGDEVITTPFSFIASSNCILDVGAKPVYVDIEEETLNINPQLIEKYITSRTKAILAVDIFGNPANWDKLKKIAEKHNLFLIEDSAESLGSIYKKKKCGSFGDAGVLAFYPNKQITTGEGGMVLTNNKKIADFCRSFANQGRELKNGKWLDHVQFGCNYRMSDINAALGVAQLLRIKEIIRKRKRIVSFYKKYLGGISKIELPQPASNTEVSWFVYVIKISNPKYRDKIITELAKKGIASGVYFKSIHLQPFYKKEFSYKAGDFPIAENISQRVIALPFYNQLKEKDIKYISENLKQIINKLK